jgi:uncharacterized membrane protein HdeD (DUF308 family)
MTTAGALDPKQFAMEQLELLKRHRGWFRALGFAWIALGLIAILVPFAAALAIDVLVGWLLIFGGVAQAVHAFRVRPWHGSSSGAFLLSGGLGIALGLMLWLGLPGTAAWAIGTLVGVNMIFGGFATLHVVRKLA